MRARAALELRAAIPQVPAGLAGLTDRALPYLFPTARPARVRLDAPGGGRDRVAAAAAGRPRRHELRRARFARHARLLHCRARPPRLRRPDRRRKRAVRTAAEAAAGSWSSSSGTRERADLPRRWSRAPVPAGRGGAGARGAARAGRPRGRARPSARAAGRRGRRRACPRVSPAASGAPLELAPYAALVGLALVLWLVLGPVRLPGFKPRRTMAGA